MNESSKPDATLGDLADHPSRGSRSIDRHVLAEPRPWCSLNQAQAVGWIFRRQRPGCL